MADLNSGMILGKNGGADRQDLGLKVYAEIMEAFDRNNVFKELISVKTIDVGVSAQFVVGGKDIGSDLTLGHTPGTDITTNAVNMNERVITIGDNIAAGTGTGNIIYDARHINGLEEKVTQYEVRGPVTSMIGSVLSHKVDTAIAAQIEAAAAVTGLAGNPDGLTETNTALPGGAAEGATAKLKGDAIADSIFDSVAAIRVNDVTAEVVVAMDPVNYSYLVRAERMVDGDFTSGNGGLDSGTIKMVSGARVVETNNMPSTAGLVALAFTKETVGMVEFQGLMAESNYDFNKFGTTITGRFAAGLGVLRPETACKIVNV